MVCHQLLLSGLTVLKGARWKGMVDAPLIKKRLLKVQKIATRASLAAWGPGASFRAWWGTGLKSMVESKALEFSDERAAFNANLHVKIIKFNT